MTLNQLYPNPIYKGKITLKKNQPNWFSQLKFSVSCETKCLKQIKLNFFEKVEIGGYILNKTKPKIGHDLMAIVLLFSLFRYKCKMNKFK